MTQQINQGAVAAVPAFDAAHWLATFAELGGGYALASDGRLHLAASACDRYDIAGIVGQIIARPDRVQAVRTAIERRRCGEVL